MRLLRALSVLLFSALAAGAGTPLEIREGDRVLLLGDVLLEREGTYGALETRLAQQFADRHFTVRNLSWSGDTPLGVARASFDPPAKGWERLQEQLAEVRPTVAILGFGMAASLQEITDRSGDILLNPDVVRYGREPMTATRFRAELAQLMDAVKKAAGGEVRFVLLAPLNHQDLRAERPGTPDPAAHNALLAQYSQAIAELAAERGADFVPLQNLTAPTTNGIHLTEAGYGSLAAHFAGQMNWPSRPENPALRQAIQRKNQLFFYRFRPSNYTYLFGFRKHEQGQNAKEIPEFDPLIAQAEKEIEMLKAGQPGAPFKAPGPEDIRPPAVPAPLPSFDVQEGYQIELWATNPLLEKPIQMNWDSAGRLWIASSSTYPQVNPEDVAATMAAATAKNGDAPSAGNDRILILEDTKHSGHADKSTVFAEGLLIPTAVAPYRNAKGQWACYVGQSTELLELTDTTGEGHADQRRIIHSGFGTEDTHHLVHTLKWGPDARLNFNQSIYIHTHMETPWGMVRLNSGGAFAWDPRTEKVEVQVKGFCNPWGHVWDPKGESFYTDGAGFQGVTWGMPGAMFFTYENGRKICPSISPGTYPKFCSLERIQSPVFPEDWQGSMITCDFRAHRIVHFGVNDLSLGEKPASGYITKELPDLVRTSDVSFRPIDVRLGPDGALYVADWSNPVINHGEVDFRDPRRDHHQGRIWRITRKGAPAVTWEKLAGKSAAELAVIGATQPAWQQQQAVVEAAYAAGGAKATTASPAPTALAEVVRDPNPRVRLNAMRELARQQTAASAELVLEAALRAPANDPYYEYAAWLSINDLAEPWSKAALSGAWRVDSAEREQQLEFALEALDPLLGAPVLTRVLEGRTLPADGSGPWIELIARAGGPKELGLLLQAITGQKLNPAATGRALGALREAARLRNARPEGDLATIEPLLSHENLPIAADAARLIGTWKTPHALTLLRELAGEGTRRASPELRLAAVDGLREFGGREVVGILQALAATRPVAGVPRAAAIALASLDLRGSLPAILGVVQELPQEAERTDTWRALLANKGASDQLAKELREGRARMDPPMAAAALRAARELGRPGKPLTEALEKVAGTAATPAAAPVQDYANLAMMVKRDGDPARGEEIFRRAQLACLTCHAIGGAGGKVGPELTSLGASAPLDYIIESILAPAAKVKEGYNAISLTLKDGTAMVGVPARETATELFLRTATGQELPVVKANIVARENIGSIMPPGLTDQLKDRERIDLYAFLSQLGKPGPYDASKGTVARYWGLQQAWAKPSPNDVPAYTLVDGRLTKETADAAVAQIIGTPAEVAATAVFQLPAAGPATLRLTGAKACLVDGDKVPLTAEETSLKLAGGQHFVTVILDPKALPPVLRLEIPEARFLGN